MKASKAEMVEHCDKYPCNECPITQRCEMYKKLQNLIEPGPDPYLIFRGPKPIDAYLIGNLMLAVAQAIHGKNIIAIDHEARHLFVKKDPKYTDSEADEADLSWLDGCQERLK